MKNLLVFYFAILLPIPLLVWAVFFDTWLFVLLLISYVIYRGFTDSRRLKELGIIEKKEMWKVFIIPFYSSYYFKELYFRK